MPLSLHLSLLHRWPLAADKTITVSIAYGDIDLSTAEGRAKLEKRVEARLRDACTIETNSRYGYGRDIVDQKCVAEARTAALNEAERIAATDARGGRQVAAN
ncbi:UrcA family protein [uncultured Erythrobacter sp.]|uniref:UrcA family protein n=1 Tax=uncultured Erythrobacter sp. TaxID=263913 RepID=UPI002601F7C4|nr:UrcA family protein [uncultured Erythrobacter sp.]